MGSISYLTQTALFGLARRLAFILPINAVQEATRNFFQCCPINEGSVNFMITNDSALSRSAPHKVGLNPAPRGGCGAPDGVLFARNRSCKEVSDYLDATFAMQKVRCRACSRAPVRAIPPKKQLVLCYASSLKKQLLHVLRRRFEKLQTSSSGTN